MGGRQLRGKKRYLLQLNEEGAGREGAGREGAGGVCLSIEKRGTERERGERERERGERKRKKEKERKRERERKTNSRGALAGQLGMQMSLLLRAWSDRDVSETAMAYRAMGGMAREEKKNVRGALRGNFGRSSSPRKRRRRRRRRRRRLGELRV